MFKAMACSLLRHEQIKTTLPKAKELRPIVEKLITMAKKGTLSANRILISRLQSNEVVKKLVNEIVPRYADRHGGYIRIMKAGFRYGDAAPMAVIELVGRDSGDAPAGELVA
jgi:large subunit ribosomal protein L17